MRDWTSSIARDHWHEHRIADRIRDPERPWAVLVALPPYAVRTTDLLPPIRRFAPCGQTTVPEPRRSVEDSGSWRVHKGIRIPPDDFNRHLGGHL